MRQINSGTELLKTSFKISCLWHRNWNKWQQNKAMLLFQIPKKKKEKSLLPEWGTRTYGQSITWLPNNRTKADTCLLIPRGKTLLCLPGVVLQMSACYDADAFFHADVPQGVWVPHRGEGDTNFSSPLRVFLFLFTQCAQKDSKHQRHSQNPFNKSVSSACLQFNSVQFYTRTI